MPFTPTAAHCVDLAGRRLSFDSVSLLRSEAGDSSLKRWFPISGEIHLGRVPAAEWAEQLLRMKAGGLNMVNAYVFWIHHEEIRGQSNFSGRRDIRAFLLLAQKLELQVMMRIGPWDHGECRNGGHPDWVLSGKGANSCGKLRSADPLYLGCVKGWYTALADQMRGLYFKDGGPITMVQVDNETSDWRFLLALRKLGLSLGITPCTYTKTGWPSPAPGYPEDSPLLPFFGGYPDQFWSSDHHSDASMGSYLISYPKQDRKHPVGFPHLGVEIGGGMAADYNHRVHLSSPDMPSMHLCDVANGFNMLGYYMVATTRTP
jgi:hypothetical protein